MPPTHCYHSTGWRRDWETFLEFPKRNFPLLTHSSSDVCLVHWMVPLHLLIKCRLSSSLCVPKMESSTRLRPIQESPSEGTWNGGRTFHQPEGGSGGGLHYRGRVEMFVKQTEIHRKERRGDREKCATLWRLSFTFDIPSLPPLFLVSSCGGGEFKCVCLTAKSPFSFRLNSPLQTKFHSFPLPGSVWRRFQCPLIHTRSTLGRVNWGGGWRMVSAEESLRGEFLLQLISIPHQYLISFSSTHPLIGINWRGSIGNFWFPPKSLSTQIESRDSLLTLASPRSTTDPFGQWD